MPNQGNKSNGKSGILQPKKETTVPSKKKDGEGSGQKESKGTNAQKHDAGNSGSK